MLDTPVISRSDVERFKVELKRRLDTKTSWGRNEVYVEVLEALLAAISPEEEANDAR